MSDSIETENAVFEGAVLKRLDEIQQRLGPSSAGLSKPLGRNVLRAMYGEALNNAVRNWFPEEDEAIDKERGEFISYLVEKIQGLK